MPDATQTPVEIKDTPGSDLRGGLKDFVLANREGFRIWLSWRLVFFILPIFAAAFVPRLPNYVKPNFTNPIEPWLERLVWCWSQWDSNWYINIATQGYPDDKTVAFYPLYPMLMRGLGFILATGQPTSESYIIAGILISSIAALALCILFLKLLKLDYSEEIARASLICLLVFPTSFFLLAVYTEGLFMALSVGAFYAARKNHWAWAMLLVALATLTRQQGIVVGIALFFEYGQQINWNWRKINYRVVLVFALPVLALVGWLTWNWLTFGNFFAPVAATQKYWGRYLGWPWNSVLLEVGGFLYREPGKNTWDPISQYWDAMPFLNLTVTIIFIVLAVYGFNLFRKSRLRLCYFIYILGCLILPLTSPVSDDPLHSLPRYLLLSFPTFIIIALLGSRSKLFRQAWLFTSMGVAGMLIARFTLGYWVA